jgi:hypothetical protein
MGDHEASERRKRGSMARVLKMKSTTPVQARNQSPTTPPHEILVTEVAAEAYALFEARAGGPGDPVSDWLEAERIVGARYAPAPRRRAKAKPRQSSAS